MNYTMYRLAFPVGVHFGDKSLEKCDFTCAADTLFSALYIEALKQGEKIASELLSGVQTGNIVLSDAFPYVGDTEYLPKPLLHIEVEDRQGDSVMKKAFKKLSYVPMDQIKEYLQGNLDVKKENHRLKELGTKTLKTSVAIHEGEDSEPYHVGICYFEDGSGLYFIVGTNQDSDLEMVYDLLGALSFAGLGGKRSSGLGRFDIDAGKKLPKEIFESESELYMSLSVGLPQQAELQDVMKGAKYQLLKRAGFVESATYALEQRKKKDIFLFSSGSCFQKKFSGDIYDVSDGGSHPVYRYAKPLFLPL